MSEKLADILFALYMNGGSGTVAWLGGYAETGMAAQVRQDVFLLASANLVTVRMQGDDAYVALTDRGSTVALGAADVIAHRVLHQWHDNDVA